MELGICDLEFMLSRISLTNFRNFEKLDLSFGPGFIILAGPNGAGKSNFLEGIYYGTHLRRFPETDFSQMFHEGRTFFKTEISARAATEDVTQETTAENIDGRYRYKLKLNGLEVARQRFAGQIPVASFLPQDLNLLTRSPGGRRHYLDETLSVVFAEYRYSHAQYEKTLKQRNELLQTTNPESGEMQIWNDKLAEFGSAITKTRAKFLNNLNANTRKIMDSLAPELADISFEYRYSGDADAGVFLTKLDQAKHREQELKTTVVGPHRDDFAVRIGFKAAVGYLSRGQLRAVTLALKIFEKQFIEAELGRAPILLADDVFSEFDSNHQEKLLNFFQTLPQVFLTTTHLETIKDFLPENSQIFEIAEGVIGPA